MRSIDVETIAKYFVAEHDGARRFEKDRATVAELAVVIVAHAIGRAADDGAAVVGTGADRGHRVAERQRCRNGLHGS